MTTKVILNAQAVRELISLEEGPVAELAKSATLQVAQELSRKLVNKDIAKAVDEAITKALGSGAYSPAVFVQKLITTHIKAQFGNLSTIEALAETLAQKVAVRAEAKLTAITDAKLQDRVDALIQTRLTALMKALK